MWTFLEVFICGNKLYVFSTVTSLISSYALQVNMCLLGDSSLLIMNANDKNSEVFSYYKNVKGEFRARNPATSLNKGLLNQPLHLC